MVLAMPIVRGSSSRAALLFGIVVLMSVLGIVLAVSSFLLWVVFPHGFYPSRVVWVDIHKWVGLVLTIVVLAHALLHRRWLLSMARRYLRRAHGT